MTRRVILRSFKVSPRQILVCCTPGKSDFTAGKHVDRSEPHHVPSCDAAPPCGIPAQSACPQATHEETPVEPTWRDVVGNNRPAVSRGVTVVNVKENPGDGVPDSRMQYVIL